MAQLPPKIPNMTPNCFEFSSQQNMSSFTRILPNAANNTNHPHHHLNNQNPSWVDEFLDFSSARRGAHRRSMSDSITFMESQMLEDCSGNSGRALRNNDNEFDMFDGDEFMSMFSDDVSGNPMMLPMLSSSNPSSPSDHNSINDEKETMNKKKEQEIQQHQQVKNESDEDESQCKQEIKQVQNNDDNNNNDNANATTFSSDKITDPKRVKRILANRQSAQRSRVRKLEYISELEQSVTSLQAEVSILSPRVAFLDHQRLLLNIDNTAFKQRIAALTQDKIFKDAHQEALKREIERLRQVYHQQNMKKMDIGVGPPSPSPSPSPRPCCDTHTEKEHLIDA